MQDVNMTILICDIFNIFKTLPKSLQIFLTNVSLSYSKKSIAIEEGFEGLGKLFKHVLYHNATSIKKIFHKHTHM